MPSSPDTPEPRFLPGQQVRTTVVDPPHHTRLPRYARGHTGIIVEYHGIYPLPDDRARGRHPARHEPVYTVRFAAAQLWSTGAATSEPDETSHQVTLDLWQSYLVPAAGEDPR